MENVKAGEVILSIALGMAIVFMLFGIIYFSLSIAEILLK